MDRILPRDDRTPDDGPRDGDAGAGVRSTRGAAVIVGGAADHYAGQTLGAVTLPARVGIAAGIASTLFGVTVMLTVAR